MIKLWNHQNSPIVKLWNCQIVKLFPKIKAWHCRLQCTASQPESTEWASTWLQTPSRFFYPRWSYHLILPFDLTICTSWLNWFDPSWPFDHVRQHWMQNLLKSDESKRVWHRLGSWILLVTALVVESDFPDIRLSLCVCRVLTYNCNNESDAFTTFQLISAPRRHTGNSPPDGPGTILLI